MFYRSNLQKTDSQAGGFKMAKITEAIFLAGGLGTRLRPVVTDVPKPMADINGKPFLHYLIRLYAGQGVTHIVLSVGHLYQSIKNYFGSSYEGVRISYSIEDHPLGTGGAIVKAMSNTETDDVFVVNADTLFDVNLNEISDFHRDKKSIMTLVVREVDNINRYGSVMLDDNSKITGFTEKGQGSGNGFINGGVYIFNKSFFSGFKFPENFSIEKDFFEKYYRYYTFFAKVCHDYFIDIGIPEDYSRARKQLPLMFE